MSSPKRLLEALGGFRAPGDGGLSREAAQALSEKIVKMSKADAINVSINAGLNTNVRFADSQMSTSGSIVDANVAVVSAFGPKHAVVTTNDLSDRGAQARTVEQAERLAKLAPGRPGIDAGARCAEICRGERLVRRDGGTGARWTARRPRCPRSNRRAPRATLPPRDSSSCRRGDVVGRLNQKRMFAYFRSTSANYTLTVRTKDGTGSGWAAADHPDWKQFDFSAVAQRAIGGRARRAIRRRLNPGATPP